MTWLLIAWSAVAALAAVAVGCNLRRRDVALAGPGADGAPASGERPGSGPKPRSAQAACDRMLALLERQEPRLAKVALLCWIGGLSAQRAADVLAMPVAQVERDSEAARVLLQRVGRG